MKHRILCLSLSAVMAFFAMTPAFAQSTQETAAQSTVQEQTQSLETTAQTGETISQSQESQAPETTQETQASQTQAPETHQTAQTQVPETQAAQQAQAQSETVSEENSNTTEGFVTRLYELTLFREPDAKGLSEWTTLLNSGQQTGADIVYGFLHSDEFQGKNYSDTEYISVLYRAILNREADDKGLNDWLSVLGEGFSRDYICSGFIGSNEFKGLCSHYGIQAGTLTLTDLLDVNPDVTKFVNRLYELVLSRTPDDKGRREWVDALVSGRNTAAVAAMGFLDSTEFKSKNLSNSDYLDVLYRTLLDREADNTGKSEWLGVMSTGVSKTYLIYNFVASPEFGTLCQQYGIERGTVSLTEPRDWNKYITSFVNQVYALALQRPASDSDLNNWARDLYNHAVSGRDFVKSIVFSAEGKAIASSDRDFVIMAYRAALLRDPAETDINSGINALRSISRESYLESILASTEFTNICANYNLHLYVEGWNQSPKGLYYVQNGTVLSGWQRINGSLYYLDPSNDNVRATGWCYADGLKYYFDANGVLVQNVDSIIGKQSSYLLKVNTTTNTVSVYARDGANGYIIPVKNMICSTGNPGTPTIHGTFTVKRLGRWWELMGPVWGQYVSQIYGGYLFHSAWYHVNGNNRTLSVSEYLKLGQNASHGCVRLTVADAKWIYDNCNGSTVTVYSSSSMDNKFDKPARPTPVVISGDYGYDPTDPAFN